jgi:outer membrane protein
VKNLSLILNGVLAVAVGILYYLHFNTSNTTSFSNNSVETSDSMQVSEKDALLDDSLMSLMPDSLPSAGTIAFVDFDELTSRYKFYSDGVKALESEFKKKQVELEARQKKFEEDVMRYQQLAPNMAEDARAAREKQLAQNEKSLYDFKDDLEGSLARKEQEFTKSFMKKIDGYFKNLSKEKDYDYIFVYSKGGPSYIVFANEELNITNVTVAGLNRQYKK